MASDGRAVSGVRWIRLQLAAGAALTGASSWAIVGLRDGHVAAALAAGGAGSLLSGGLSAHRAGTRAERIADGVLDRCFDGAVLGSIAWTARTADPWAAAGALAALCASFLSSYVRARGAALGYDVEESVVTRTLRVALIVLGLALGWLWWTLWVVAGLCGLAAFVRTSQVVKEERA
jgi:CDP-diacylglycerol--glycerol-3-phosphate 3-phosphatidyltransferase